MPSETRAPVVRNRIVGHGVADPASLMPNPANWRTHSATQEKALRGVLAEVGYVQDVIVNRTTGRLVDGHLRVAIARADGAAEIPVKYVELTENEEKLVLAALDPIGAMAGRDREMLQGLLAQLEVRDARTRELVRKLAASSRGHTAGDDATQPQLTGLVYRVVVDCVDEAHQQDLLGRFQREGLRCRALIS